MYEMLVDSDGRTKLIIWSILVVSYCSNGNNIVFRLHGEI